MNLIHAPANEFDAHDFEDVDIALFVRLAREKKAIVTAAVEDLDETQILTDYDALPSDKKKKTQNFIATSSTVIELKECN